MPRSSTSPQAARLGHSLRGVVEAGDERVDHGARTGDVLAAFRVNHVQQRDPKAHVHVNAKAVQ